MTPRHLLQTVLIAPLVPVIVVALALLMLLARAMEWITEKVWNS